MPRLIAAIFASLPIVIIFSLPTQTASTSGDSNPVVDFHNSGNGISNVEDRGSNRTTIEKQVEDIVVGVLAETPESPKSVAPTIAKSRVAFCFAPGTPDHVMANTRIQLGLGQERFFQVPRWSTTATNMNTGMAGDPIVLTYSFPPDGTEIPAIAEVNFPAGVNDFHAWMNGLYGSEAQWLPIFQAAFDRWSIVCGITFVYEPNDDGAAMNLNAGVLGVRGDVRIGGKPLDGTNSVVAYNTFPDDGDMVFDTGDSFYEDMSDDSLWLRNTIAHEHGHGMGLLHSCPQNNTKLMEPFVSLAYDGPQHDDILGAQSHYGDPFEPNDTALAATQISPINQGATVTLGDIPPPSTNSASQLSIDGDGDRDYFLISMAERSLLRVAVEARGIAYSTGMQTCPSTSMACCSGDPTNSQVSADLDLALFAADGSTLLFDSDQSVAGGDEALDVVVDAGDYYVVVGESDAPTMPQFYRLTVATNEIPDVTIAFPNGVPSSLQLDDANEFFVQIVTEQTIVPGSATLFFSINGDTYQSAPLIENGDDLYTGQLPADYCEDTIEFYVTVETLESGIHFAPETAPTAPFMATITSFPDCVDTLLIPVFEGSDQVYDSLRNVLYISTEGGTIERWDISTGTSLPSWNIGGVLFGMDITEANDALYVCDISVAGTTANLRKVDLNSGDVTDLPFTITGSELGPWDVAIGTNGRSLVSTDYAGSGTAVGFRSFTVGQDVITPRNDITSVRKRTTFRRSGDRRRIVMLQGSSSSGPVNIYDAERDIISGEYSAGESVGDSVSSVNRNGQRVALNLRNGVRMLRESLATETIVTGYRGGILYDPNEDLFYGVDDDADEVAVVNANTNEELYRVDIGADVDFARRFDRGELSITADRQWLFLSMEDGVQQIRMNRPESRILVIRDELPLIVKPNSPLPYNVRILEHNDALVPGSATIHVRVGAGEFQSLPLIDIGGGEYSTTLPGVQCGEVIQFYFTAEGEAAGEVVFPSTGAASPYAFTPNSPLDCRNPLRLPLDLSMDVVHDSSRNRVYMTTSTGYLERLDLATGRLLDPIPIGQSLRGMDITPDYQFLYICERMMPASGLGTVYKLNLATNTWIEITYSPSQTESAPFDLVVLDNNIAIFSTFAQWDVPLRQIDLTTDQQSVRFDLPEFDSPAYVERSADRGTLLIVDGSSNPDWVRVYDPDLDGIIASDQVPTFGDISDIAVSRDGNQLATTDNLDMTIRDRMLTDIADLVGPRGAIAYDPVRNLLYRCDDLADQIRIYSTITFDQVSPLPAGADIPPSNGQLHVSDDGRLLFAKTDSRLQMVAVPAGDCNNNGIDDVEELAEGLAIDCNGNLRPDSCELENDCNQNMIPDECEEDCNNNGIADECDLTDGTASDCDANGQLDECQLDPDDISQWLNQLTFYHPDITSLVPSRFDFSDGAVGTRILDGGNNMYDNGNRLDTNRMNDIEYTNNTIAHGDEAFGPGSLYFTAKFDGIFALAVLGMDISLFEIDGGLGADGNGFVDDATIPITVNNSEFTLFVKRVWGAGVPSVNHLVIVPGDGEQVFRIVSTNTNNDDDSFYQLDGIDRLFYILVAQEGGLYLDDETATAIGLEFIQRLNLAATDCNENVALDSCETDCNENGIPDECDIADGTSDDLDGNGIPDNCPDFELGDLNCDLSTDLLDVPLFVDALVRPSSFSGCYIQLADLNNDGDRNGGDLPVFVDVLLGN